MSLLTSRKENYSKWYNELIEKSDLAENSGVRGCMIIKPYGFSIWEKMQRILDGMFKETGHENAYFPIFIPKSYFSKEANHINGFAKECAIVTHYRLKHSFDKKKIIIDPKSKLEEELIIRPTSETIIWNTYRRWIQSYRDLPILLNQWANIVRWEMRPRLFLRTSEFLWQEGHTAHATQEEAIIEAKKILKIYTDFTNLFLGIPVIQGVKSPSERFSGAEETYCIEAIMQDGKALQVGTSHFLGQNFSKAFDVKFLNKFGKQEYVWSTSWGISTRLIGALIMTHSDDDGLVLPPKLAPIQVVIIPFIKNKAEQISIDTFALNIKNSLEYQKITVKYDNRENPTPGWKFNEYKIKGIPIQLSLGSRNLINGQIDLVRRDLLKKEYIHYTDLQYQIPKILDDIQNNLFQKAVERTHYFMTSVNNYTQFKEILYEKGGFLSAHWDGTPLTEDNIKYETKATIRCIPLTTCKEEGSCIYSGKASHYRVLFARAY